MLNQDDVRTLLADRPAQTRTHRVPSDVLKKIQLDSSDHLRIMDHDEVVELAGYLGEPVEGLQGPFMVVDVHCQDCDRHLTFLDFAKTAVDQGAHDHAQLREVLAGRRGAWLTIRGRDGGRPVTCSSCSATLRMRPGYSEYSSSSYAYA